MLVGSALKQVQWELKENVDEVIETLKWHLKEKTPPQDPAWQEWMQSKEDAETTYQKLRFFEVWSPFFPQPRVAGCEGRRQRAGRHAVRNERR